MNSENHIDEYVSSGSSPGTVIERAKCNGLLLEVIPLTLAEANEAVARFHRHHKKVVGHRYSIGVVDQFGSIRGCAIVGRPVARNTDWHSTAEVTRLATDGTPNACSMLYAAAARASQAMGFAKIQSFILESENGASLKASGWMFEAWSAGGDWNSNSRGGRRTDQPMVRKQRWVRIFKRATKHESAEVAA